jgi:ABC-type transport system involved in multi-copper enzyme maturation permease subunit
MTEETITAYRPSLRTGPDSFARLLRAEWTKFRTVRGWVIGMIIAALLIVGIGLLNHSSCGGEVTPGGPSGVGAGCSSPVGPGGEAVTDNFYFVHRQLTGDGSITARMTSLRTSGLQPWAKAGIIVKATTRPGSAYAAMMLTGRHGVRMQYDYTGDVAGPAGVVSAKTPRWLRLTRSGDKLTGYESADGTHWRTVGVARLAGLPATVQAGLFAASPTLARSTSQSVTGTSAGSGVALATGDFDHVGLSSQRPGGAWAGSTVGGGPGGAPSGTGFHQARGTFTVIGTGDIAPDVPGAADASGGADIGQTLLGAFGGLIAVIVVAAMFMTAEYRRGLIRVTLAASPRRGRVLAAKAVVVGTIAFIAGLAGSIAAVPLGERLLRSNGSYILPVSAFTQVRVVAGTAAVLAIAAVLALALGALLRSSTAAITVAIVVIVLPYLMVNALPALPPAGSDWLLRVTPAAALAIQQTLPRYSQVAASYTPGNGYYPLAPWAGLAVLCGYTAVVLGLAIVRLRRRDA